MIPILTTASTVMCPHGGMAQLVTTNTDALIDGAPALLQTDVHPIVGCPFTPVAYSPCVLVRWVTAAVQTSVRNVPVLLQTSVGLCLNAAQAPQGTALVVQVQQKAKGI
jgi:ABC-type amino acid transport system permease subunit